MKKKKIIEIIKNRYVITGVLFIIWLGFIDHNNLIERRKINKENQKLFEIKEEYKNKIDETNDAMKALDDEEYLEKLAREKYLMKKKNEDLYIVTE